MRDTVQTHICDKCSETWNFYHYCKVEIDELIRERLDLVLAEAPEEKTAEFKLSKGCFDKTYTKQEIVDAFSEVYMNEMFGCTKERSDMWDGIKKMVMRKLGIRSEQLK